MHPQPAQQTGKQGTFALETRAEGPGQRHRLARHRYVLAAGAGALSGVAARNGKNYLAMAVRSPMPPRLGGGVSEQTCGPPPLHVVMDRGNGLVRAGALGAAHAEPILELSIAAKPIRLRKLTDMGNGFVRSPPEASQ